MSDDPHGWDAFWALYESGRWEPNTRELITRLLRPGDLMVDVGAWIGPVTLWAVAAGARVIALEPDPVAYPELVARTAAHRGNVQCWPVALGLEPGHAWLAPNPKPGGALGDSMSRIDPARGVRVAVRTLAQILGPARPTLVKVDIEGGEVDLMPALAPRLALRGAALQVSCHGTFPDRTAFAAFSTVTWPDDPWGDVIAIP